MPTETPGTPTRSAITHKPIDADARQNWRDYYANNRERVLAQQKAARVRRAEKARRKREAVEQLAETLDADDEGRSYKPLPCEIEHECAKIQAGWTDAVRASRWMKSKPGKWEPK